MRSITITYEGVPPLSLRKNKGTQSHWRYRQKDTRTMRENAYILILEALEGSSRPHFDRFSLDITQYWCGKPLDAEALASGTGGMVDAFMDVGIIDDDSPHGFLVDYRLHWKRVKTRPERKVVMKISKEEGPNSAKPMIYDKTESSPSRRKEDPILY